MQCRALDLGLIGYEDAHIFQKNILKEIKLQDACDTIIFCEHPPVITLGRLAKRENILVDDLELERKGIVVYYTDRGGDVTFHSPGQLVIYPIFDLKRHSKDIRLFLRNLEKIIVNSLRIYGVLAGIKEGLRGVWVEDNKIVSVGIGIKNWITYHGAAVNINNDMHYFSYIRPCGIKKRMVSLTELLNRKIDIEETKEIILENFKFVFNLDGYFKNNFLKNNQLGGELLYDTSCVT